MWREPGGSSVCFQSQEDYLEERQRGTSTVCPVRWSNTGGEQIKCEGLEATSWRVAGPEQTDSGRLFPLMIPVNEHKTSSAASRVMGVKSSGRCLQLSGSQGKCGMNETMSRFKNKNKKCLHINMDLSLFTVEIGVESSLICIKKYRSDAKFYIIILLFW